MRSPLRRRRCSLNIPPGPQWGPCRIVGPRLELRCSPGFNVGFRLNLGLSFKMHRHFFLLFDGHVYHKSLATRIQRRYNESLWID